MEACRRQGDREVGVEFEHGKRLWIARELESVMQEVKINDLKKWVEMV